MVLAMTGDQRNTSIDEDEKLPFAMTEESEPQSLFGFKMNIFSADIFCDKTGDLEYSASSNPPALVSSIMSESQASSVSDYSYTRETITQNSAIQMEPTSSCCFSTVGVSLHLPLSCDWVNGEASSMSEQGGSIGFSELMEVADNTSDVNRKSVLPVLQEEDELQSNSSQSSDTVQASGTRPEITTISPSSSAATEKMTNSHHFFNADPVSQFSLVGAEICAAPGYLNIELNKIPQQSIVEAEQLDCNSFQVAVDISPSCSLRDVMDVLGNPDLLRQWCDPIRALIVTRSSEGSMENQCNREEGLREYEGEWIEATTLDLISPATKGSYLYKTGQAVWSFIGFPSYGKVTMFVERNRGQVGLTIGPFAGQVMASHTITIHDLQQNGIRIIDKVQLSREESDWDFMCGVSRCVENCILPSIDGYMSQVSSSMRRLRQLVESGERGPYGEVIVNGESTLDAPLLPR